MQYINSIHEPRSAQRRLRLTSFTRWLGVLGLMLMLLTFPGPTSAKKVATLRTFELSCEHAINPLGLDVAHPRLSWKMRAAAVNDRGQLQTAYQVLVASTAAKLRAGHGDLWDAGKMPSGQSVLVDYAGKPLMSHQACYWKVRVWDRDGTVSAWSAPGLWTMGVLAPSEWRARWIGVGVMGADWQDYTLETRFTLKQGAAGIYFRAQGASNAYMWQINSFGAEPVLKVHLRVGGAYAILKQVPLGHIITRADLERPHTLRLQLQGARIETFLDGHLVDTTTDATLSHGGIGLREGTDESAIFHSLRVLNVSGQTLFNADFTPGGANPFTAGTPGPDGLTVSDSDALLSGNLRTPRLRREFALPRLVRRAWIYASALGLYELRLNGQRVGDQLYAPGWTDYRLRVQYQTYDVTKLLHPGANAIGAQLAPGWYAGNIAWFGPNHYGDTPQFFAQLHIEYADGSHEVIATDEQWQASPGPVVAADNQDGETYDARLEQPGWDEPGFNEAAWRPVTLFKLPAAVRLVAQLDPPIRITQQLKPIAVTEPQPGVYIYNFGQDMTGVARIRVQGRAGTTVKLRHAECLNPDGTLNTITLANQKLARALATDLYMLKSNAPAVYQPQFTWHGFQYLEISGVEHKPSLDDVTGMVMGTDVPHVGQLQTSNALLNQLQSNLQWSGRDAYMSIPMDCPQRSERLGWTGDANFYVATATFNFDMARFYTKWQRDIVDSQSPNGLMSNVAPSWTGLGGYGGGWGDAGVGVPYALWQSYGDTGIIRDNYGPMAKWLEFLQSKSHGLIVPADLAPAGDWQNQGDDTPHDLIATAYFAYDAILLAQMARAIGKTADAQHYDELFTAIRSAFSAKYVTADGTVGPGSQTAYVLALHIGLIPDNLRAAAGQKLVANLNAHDNHLTTGFVGTQWLLPVLSELGRSDLAYAVVEQTNRPSWGYMISHGATTIWEGWGVVNADGTVNGGQNSLNHCALGSVGAWMYQTIGGIAPDPQHPGYRRYIIRPRPGGSLTSANASYNSVYGPIATAWRLSGAAFELDVTIPVNSAASVYLPASSLEAITESGQPIKRVGGIHFERMEQGSAVLAVGSGTYRFRARVQ